jgi:NAD(P)-dependent dehydrogenase (short-subunit alcohol dehydrogenase family)
MVTRVLVLGGTGNFGGTIARALAGTPAIRLLIGSRSATNARAHAKALNARNPAEAVEIDIHAPDLASRIRAAAPQLVIHSVGPYQKQNYRVAEAAIACGAHYLDLADARAFVAGIGALDNQAREAGVAVISGASSVPCLTAAFIDYCLAHFTRLTSVDYGISAAQATNRGLGTASAILSYVGRPFTRLSKGRIVQVHGWQGLRAVRYPTIGVRLMGDCDIPDLELFPARYPTLRNLRFQAGHEIKLLHLGTWLLSWLVRLRLLPTLDRFGSALLRATFLFDPLGTDRSGFHMRLDGEGLDGGPCRFTIFLEAREGHGPMIPCIPVILLARQIAAGDVLEPGARAYLDLVGLDEYLGALQGLAISANLIGPGVHRHWPEEAA